MFNRILQISLLCCAMSNLCVRASEKKSFTFTQCVELITADSQKEKITDPAAVALLDIVKLLPNCVSEPAYKKLQQCDLSHMMRLLPQQYPQFLEKIIPASEPNAKHLDERLQKVTIFRNIKGQLAQHNTTVTYDENETSLFYTISDHHLDITRELYRYKAHYFPLVGGMAGAELLAWENNWLADLIEQEVCLRNNAKKNDETKIYEYEVMYKSKNLEIARKIAALQLSKQQTTHHEK